MKLGGQFGYMTRMNPFEFGEDPNSDLDTRIIQVLTDSSPLKDGAKNDIACYLKRFWMDSAETLWQVGYVKKTN